MMMSVRPTPSRDPALDALLDQLERELGQLEHILRLQDHERIEPQSRRLQPLLAQTMDRFGAVARLERISPDQKSRLKQLALQVRQQLGRLARTTAPLDQALATMLGDGARHGAADPAARIRRGYAT